MGQGAGQGVGQGGVGGGCEYIHLKRTCCLSPLGLSGPRRPQWMLPALNRRAVEGTETSRR